MENEKPFEGWWLVRGLRHHALAKAYSAQEAIAKADKQGGVDKSWESPDAVFLGKELPEVVKL